LSDYIPAVFLYPNIPFNRDSNNIWLILRKKLSKKVTVEKPLGKKKGSAKTAKVLTVLIMIKIKH